MQRQKRKIKNGFGLVDAIIYIGLISIVIAVSLNFLSTSFGEAAKRRKLSLVKKSFGGAEIALIDQRQCRCNLLNKKFPIDVAEDAKIKLGQIKTFEDVDACADTMNDGVLSDTTANANMGNRAEAIYVTDFKKVVAGLLYRATMVIAPEWGRPVEFPILISTHPENANSVVVEICGVDRAS